MPCGIFYDATCHNPKPSLTIIINDGDQYFEKTLCPKIFIVTSWVQV